MLNKSGWFIGVCGGVILMLGIHSCADDSKKKKDTLRVTQIEAGSDYTCALKSNNVFQCWGDGGVGGLGNGKDRNTEANATYHEASPTNVKNIGGVRQFSAGNLHTCAVLTSGAIKCWGLGLYGTLGNGILANQLVPVDVADITNAVEVAAGGAHSCALLATGTVKCWGIGSNGQIGNGMIEQQATPVDVSGLTNVTQIAAGVNHNCVVVDGGTVKCWGSGNSGQLGNGALEDQSTPVDVEGITGAIKVASGSTHSCALLSDGNIKCWGFGANGELGNGQDASTGGGDLYLEKNPVDVVDLGMAIDLALGVNHTCAVLDTGGVQCWGLGAQGQLGNGEAATTASNNLSYHSAVPVDVITVVGADLVTAGNYHTCVVVPDTKIRCWGSGKLGQLGNGKDAVTEGDANYLAAEMEIVVGY